MSLEARLNDSLNDILKTSGYIFEIINNNKKQLNLITGTNNQLISQPIVQQLARNLAKFDEILDETVSKFNDVKWCVEETVGRQQREAELKIKEQLEQQRREEEAKRQEEQRREEEGQRQREEEERRKRLEQERIQKEKLEKERLEKQRLEKEKQERERREWERQEKEREEKERKEREVREAEASLANFNQPFDFDLGGLEGGIPNPTDILSTINYQQNLGDLNDSNNMMNDLLQNDDSLLGGLNLDQLDSGFDGNNQANLLDDGFDVDNFLNQFDQ